MSYILKIDVRNCVKRKDIHDCTDFLQILLWPTRFNIPNLLNSQKVVKFERQKVVQILKMQFAYLESYLCLLHGMS